MRFAFLLLVLTLPVRAWVVFTPTIVNGGDSTAYTVTLWRGSLGALAAVGDLVSGQSWTGSYIQTCNDVEGTPCGPLYVTYKECPSGPIITNGVMRSPASHVGITSTGGLVPVPYQWTISPQTNCASSVCWKAKLTAANNDCTSIQIAFRRYGVLVTYPVTIQPGSYTYIAYSVFSDAARNGVTYAYNAGTGWEDFGSDPVWRPCTSNDSDTASYYNGCTPLSTNSPTVFTNDFGDGTNASGVLTNYALETTQKAGWDAGLRIMQSTGDRIHLDLNALNTTATALLSSSETIAASLNPLDGSIDAVKASVDLVKTAVDTSNTRLQSITNYLGLIQTAVNSNTVTNNAGFLVVRTAVDAVATNLNYLRDTVGTWSAINTNLLDELGDGLDALDVMVGNVATNTAPLNTNLNNLLASLTTNLNALQTNIAQSASVITNNINFTNNFFATNNILVTVTNLDGGSYLTNISVSNFVDLAELTNLHDTTKGMSNLMMTAELDLVGLETEFDASMSAWSNAAAAYEDKANSAASYEYPSPGSGFWTKTIAGHTVNFDPLADPQIAAMAAWVRNIVTWLLIVGYVGWALMVSFEVISQYQPPSWKAPATLLQAGLSAVGKVAAWLAAFVIAATISEEILGYVMEKFGSADALTHAPFSGGPQLVVAAVYLLDAVVPLSLGVSYALNALWFRSMAIVWVLRFSKSKATAMNQ